MTPDWSSFQGSGLIILEGLCVLYAGVFQGRGAGCRVELCRTRVNFAALALQVTAEICFFRRLGGDVSEQKCFPRLPLVFRRSSAVAFGCGRSSTDPAHIRRQMRRALRLDESLREQLKTKSDIRPLNSCREDLRSRSAESWDALQPGASYFLLMIDGVCDRQPF